MSLMHCSKPEYDSIHYSLFPVFYFESMLFPAHWNMYGKCKCFTTLEHIGKLRPDVKYLMSYCSFCCACSCIHTKNAHVLLYPHRPMLTRTGKVAFPIKLHYVTWLRPPVPLFSADVPDVAFPKLFDPCLTGVTVMLHSFTFGTMLWRWIAQN